LDPGFLTGWRAVTDEIETSRLHLRAYGPHDIDHLAGLYADPEVAAYTKLGCLDRRQAEATLAGYLEDWRDAGCGMFAAFLKTDGSYAGECGLFTLEKTGERALRYAFHKHLWGRGLAREAVAGVLDDAFGRRGLERLVSFVEAPNQASHRVMQNLGLTVERVAQLPKAELHVYAVTAGQWLGRRT
jgi:ribosomal-protein-alanine N-acetyltransferase